MTKSEILSQLLKDISFEIGISKSTFDRLKQHYEAMGNWLSSDTSSLKGYAPAIRPQGSFMLGTVVLPVNKKDDLDIDLVCELCNKPAGWTQETLKNAVGARVESNGVYDKKRLKNGRRCWTVYYADSTEKSHMDILPCFVASGYNVILERAFSNSNVSEQDVSNLALSITDNTRFDYDSETNTEYWQHSNPFGYARWFLNIASISRRKTRYFSLNESVEHVKQFSDNKSPLQRVVQLMKRHRDILFNGNEDKPISIIITTLAANAYGDIDDEDFFTVFKKIAANMASDSYIKKVNGIDNIANPVNAEENFADKWPDNPIRKINFYKWINQLNSDIARMERANITELKDLFKDMFGEDVSKTAFNNYGKSIKSFVDSSKARMAAVTGAIGSKGTVFAHNSFYGKENE